MKEKITVSSGLQWLYAPNIAYHDYGGTVRRLQVLFPYGGGERKFPLILFIPGSAWHKQEMYNDIPQYARLAERGYVVAAMEYRESDIAEFPAQIEDVQNALEFMPTVADLFHINMERVYLMGNSSGGHVALMAALWNAHGLCELPKISGVIAECPATDLLLCAEGLPPGTENSPSSVLLGVRTLRGNEEKAKRASCGKYVTKDVSLPSILLIHGEFDPIVSAENSRTLYERLTETGHKARYCEISGYREHGGAGYFGDVVLGIVDEFLNDNP